MDGVDGRVEGMDTGGRVEGIAIDGEGVDEVEGRGSLC